jgi:hypothetical protein
MLHPEPFSPEIVESEFRFSACGRNDGAQQQIQEVFFQNEKEERARPAVVARRRK